MNRENNIIRKSIDEFVPEEDTIYISKMKGGHQIIYFCRFVSYTKGVVTGDVISCEPEWACNRHSIKRGLQVRARLGKCFLFGLFEDDTSGMSWSSCHWFDTKTKKVEGA